MNMEKQEKKYTIRTTRFGRSLKEPRVSEVTETLEGLKKYFSYTFEIGYSWNNKINTNPKTINSFVTNLQKSYEEKEANCYDRTSVELVK
jgi:hypothetical protein